MSSDKRVSESWSISMHVCSDGKLWCSENVLPAGVGIVKYIVAETEHTTLWAQDNCAKPVIQNTYLQCRMFAGESVCVYNEIW